jgi:uncharacterized membrane protein YdbT with pleckstrin-like domain
MSYDRSPSRRAERTLWTGHPSWKGMIGLYLKWEGSALLLTVLGFYLAKSGAIGWGVWVLFTLLANGSILWFLRLYRKLTTFSVTSHYVHDTRFVWKKLGRAHEKARVSRIQNVTVEQSLLEKLLGIGTVDSNTAGEEAGDLFRWKGIPQPHVVSDHIESAMNGDYYDEEDEIAEREDDEPRRREYDDRPRGRYDGENAEVRPAPRPRNARHDRYEDDFEHEEGL